MSSRAVLLFLLITGTVLVQKSSGSAEENPLRLIRRERAAIKWDTDIKLTVTPSVLSKSARWVNVTWSNVLLPRSSDWIGLWVLSDAEAASIDPKHHAPVKYKFCSQSMTHVSSGSGVLQFYMVNMRATFQFGFLRGGLDHPELSVVSNTVTFENVNEPLQGHLSLTKDHSEMRLLWVSKEASSGPQVQWGTASGDYSNTRNATSSTYKASDMCDSPATDYGWIDPGMFHDVTMDNLVAGTKYYYRYGNSAGEGDWSDEHVFVAPPTPGPQVTTRILAYGDLGHGDPDNASEVIHLEQPSLNTTGRLMADSEDNDIVFHIGDIAYAEGFGGTWEEFFDQVGPLMRRLPYMVNPGNHESDSKNSDAYYQGHDSGGECNVPYVHRFAMPRPDQHQPWYGFRYGSVHVIMMSTEQDFRTSSKQFAGLVELFEAVNRTMTPWLIFSGHRPMYVDSDYSIGVSSDQVVAASLRKYIEPLLVKYKVDLALWGHHHSYQRTCHVYDSKCVDNPADAPVHVVIGMAGQHLSQNILRTTPPIYEFVDDQHYGYTRIIANSSALTLEYIRDIDGKSPDKLVLAPKNY